MSNFLQKTYLVCNSGLIKDISKIDGFLMNLGQALVNKNRNILHPADVCIQTHILFFKEIILLYGYLGSLHIYTNNSYPLNKLSVFNSEDRVDIDIVDNTIMNAINKGLKEMAKLTGYNTNTTTPKNVDIVKEEYIKPNKTMKEMDDNERKSFMQNWK